MTLERYEQTLDIWAEEERARAAEAKAAGDERLHSIHLMKASMLGPMLRTLGRVELEGRRGALEKIALQQEQEAEKHRKNEDFDAAERSLIKAETIRRAMKLLDEEEA